MGEVICRNCGHRNQEGANFCSSCGQPIERADDPTTMTFVLDTDPGAEVPSGVAASAFGSLVVTRGPNTGSAFELEHVITTLGRHPDSDIFLDDVTVSRRHVEVERTPTGTVVRDVGSLNGTYLNQKRIDGDVALTGGDELQVGKFKLVFVAAEEGQ
ncbi:MAG: FHA domain-containing protein [Acidimicrobiales bacterium]